MARERIQTAPEPLSTIAAFSLHLIDKNLAQSQFGVNVTKNAVSLDVNPLDYGHKRNKSKST
jgi:hypothetical protein